MVRQIPIPNPRNDDLRQLYESELSRLRQKGALENRLAAVDKTTPFRRIYVMGCGRSGTWLLTNVMSMFNDLEVVSKELPFEYFGLLLTDRSALVLKRDHLAYERIALIPDAIEIAYIVRHPFDVLTSRLPGSRRLYHISPDRWLGEMTSLQYLLDTRRKNTKVIRYEDLASKPRECQLELASSFRLEIGRSIDELYTSSNNPFETTGTLHRARRVDTNSVNKHKNDVAKIDYLKKIKPGIGPVLDWVGSAYDYDLSL
jgi:hypothetical protein